MEVSWGAGQRRTNRPGMSPCEDGRGKAARQFRKILRGLARELGVNDASELTESEQLQLACIASAGVEHSAMVQAKLAGDAVDSIDVAKAQNILRHALDAFDRLKEAHSKRREPTLARLLADLPTARATPDVDHA